MKISLPKSAAADRIDTMRIYRKILKENIENDHLCGCVSYDRDMWDEMVEIALDLVCSIRKQSRIGSRTPPNKIFKQNMVFGPHIPVLGRGRWGTPQQAEQGSLLAGRTK